jgi:hypothetical protein
MSGLHMRHARLLLVLAAVAGSAAMGSGQSGPGSPRVTLVRLPDGAIQPQLVADSAGVLHLLYFKGEAAHGDLFYAQVGGNGSFSRTTPVNARSGSAIATGTMRGGHLAIGRNGRVHVAWHGSDQAQPRAQDGATPVLYTRMNTAGSAFEPERNVVSRPLMGLDGGTVAADAAGNVYVAWHAFQPGLRGEDDRRVWIARSSDDGRTFMPENAASNAATGACGCCAVGALADRRGTLYVLYRAATQVVHRDTYLLTSHDRAATFASAKLQEWNIGACPMSSFSLDASPSGVRAAWETDGQVQWLRLDPAAGTQSNIVAAPGSATGRKHPVIATNESGETMLAWTEGTGWNKGGGLAWQVFDREGRPVGTQGRVPGIPTWSLAAVAALPDGQFVIVY